MNNLSQIRNSNFTGQIGEFNTTYNSLVRMFGKTKADEFKLNKELYKDLNFFINGEANTSYRNGENVRHPKFKVPAFYGMGEELYKELAPQRKAYVSAYKTEWLESKINEFFKIPSKKEKTQTKPLSTKSNSNSPSLKRGPKPKSNSQINVVRNMLNTGNWFSEMDLTKAIVPNLEERYRPGHRAARGYIKKLRDQKMEIITRETQNPYTGNSTIEYGKAKNSIEYIQWRIDESKNNGKLRRGRRKLND
tara:strand:+ start:706 stop:1452 length:747 start_codon:yes stop_codon:yes gene_type:complete